MASTILQTGRIPERLRLVHIVPLDKPGKEESSCDSKRPISLINTTIKIIEYAICNRVIHGVEKHFHPSLYGYRRSRGTDTHLDGLLGGINRDLTQGSHVYLSSLDIKGAFDTLPHQLTERAMKEANVEPYCARLQNQWTTKRKFQVRITTAKGRYLSSKRPIARGLPQGGILSPMLWVLVFSTFSRQTEARLAANPFLQTNKVEWRFYVYADDIALTLTHSNPETLVQAACICHQYIMEGLAQLHLELSTPKCNNVVFSPNNIVGIHFRRNNGL